MTYSELISLRIRNLCVELNMKPGSLSARAGLRPSTIDSIMKGKSINPKMQTMHKIAFAFSMTLADFLDFKELNDADPTDVMDSEGLKEDAPESESCN